MTNVKALTEAIESRGVKVSFLAEQLRMTPQGFYKKLTDNSDFKAWQMVMISDILHLSNSESRVIFFEPNVGK